MSKEVTPPGAIREIVLAALQDQSVIKLDVLTSHVAAEMNREDNESMMRSVAKTLHHMRADGLVNYEDGVISAITGAQPAKKIVADRNFVQSNPTTERVELPPYLLQRAPFTVTFETSPVPVDNVIKVEQHIAGRWVEVDGSGGLRVCMGSEKPVWSPYEVTNTGVTAIRVTLRTGEVQIYGHNPDMPLTTLKR